MTRLGGVLVPLQYMLERNKDLLAVSPYDGNPATLGQQIKTDKDKDAPSNPESSESTEAVKEAFKYPSRQEDLSDEHEIQPAPAPFPSYATTLSSARALTSAGEVALAPLAAVDRLLHSDLIYGRFATSDFDALHWFCRRLVGRADGLVTCFGLVEAGSSTIGGVVPNEGPTTPAEVTFGVAGGTGGRTRPGWAEIWAPR